MIYIIDDQVTYNSDDCTLGHLPTQETLSLSISSGRLFEQLLNSEGEILSRDTLLTEVWDKYGLRGSNSNLNQYLSILRRALAAYGCENLIITIPKIGIRLNTEIKIERESSLAFTVPEFKYEIVSAESAISAQESQTIPPDQVMPDNVIKKSPFNVRQAIFAFIILMFLGGALWYITSAAPTAKNFSSNTIKLQGGCEAVIIQGLDVLEQKSLDKQILEILKENNQACVPGRRIYFDKNTAFTTKDYGRTILSACNLNSSGHIVSCDNFYYLDWRMF
ncbi:winged helix-turn-helix domain-containing protein [Pantoea vagans]|uniref:winged helix-turn-helix domain-containing protein n=1 Tax=Pantoea vagans TaxID=470934 RepID=UPI00076AE6F9|nr:winged helix-turn-helix domain-containing protein [Pantoea vagans]AMG56712.1 transcriptional regulator [Pantoea vagans]